ncbi:MAG: hypothetical protein IID54_02385 [Proteobacteria bacterium]|nr:hypothetical protein [Pseudomonadota bacterium]
MRAHLGGYFFGQIATFMYLLQSMGQLGQFDVAQWPQFSVYNLVVANFWPAYWLAHFIDRSKLDEAYWHVYDVAQAQVSGVMQMFQLFVG